MDKQAYPLSVMVLQSQIRGSFYQRESTWILAWSSNHMPSKMWDEITYPFPNFNGCTVDVWNG